MSNTNKKNNFYEYCSDSSFQFITDDGRLIDVDGHNLQKTASLDIQLDTEREMGEHCILIKQEIIVENKRYTATSGFAAEHLLKIMSPQMCCSESIISRRKSENFEVVKLLESEVPCDSQNIYCVSVAENTFKTVPTETAHFSMITHYFPLLFCISGNLNKKLNKIISIEGSIKSAPFHHLDGSLPVGDEIFFKIPIEELFFTNTIGVRKLDEDGALPTYSRMIGKDEEETKPHTWWKDFGVNIPIIWHEQK